MGPFVRIGFAGNCERKLGFDEAGALRAAVDIVANNDGPELAVLKCGLRELSTSTNALAALKGDVLESPEARLV
jgi:hypothetical protein